MGNRWRNSGSLIGQPAHTYTTSSNGVWGVNARYASSLTPDLVPGEAVFTTTSTSSQNSISWTVPAGVTSISIALVGGGGGANACPGTSNFSGGGGGGGGLGYRNNYAVTPGQTLYALVGNAGAGGSSGTSSGSAGGDSLFRTSLGSGTICGAGGGNGGVYSQSGGVGGSGGTTRTSATSTATCTAAAC